MCPGERGISAHETNMSVWRSRCRPSAIRRPLSSSKRANQIAADFVNGLLDRASQTAQPEWLDPRPSVDPANDRPMLAAQLLVKDAAAADRCPRARASHYHRVLDRPRAVACNIFHRGAGSSDPG